MRRIRFKFKIRLLFYRDDIFTGRYFTDRWLGILTPYIVA